MPNIVIVPDWVSEIAEHYADEAGRGCPVDVAIGMAVMQALNAPAVLTLPPEPPVGTVVEVIDGHHAGERLTHVGVSGWWTERGTAFTWAGLLAYWAGPAGVRVVGGG